MEMAGGSAALLLEGALLTAEEEPGSWLLLGLSLSAIISPKNR